MHYKYKGERDRKSEKLIMMNNSGRDDKRRIKKYTFKYI